METKNSGSDSPYKAKWVFCPTFYFSISLVSAYPKVYLNFCIPVVLGFGIWCLELLTQWFPARDDFAKGHLTVHGDMWSHFGYHSLEKWCYSHQVYRDTGMLLNTLQWARLKQIILSQTSVAKSCSNNKFWQCCAASCSEEILFRFVVRATWHMKI